MASIDITKMDEYTPVEVRVNGQPVAITGKWNFYETKVKSGEVFPCYTPELLADGNPNLRESIAALSSADQKELFKWMYDCLELRRF